MSNIYKYHYEIYLCEYYCKLFYNTNLKILLYSGPVVSLKHEKSDVETINKDIECGLMVENTDIEFMPGDKIVCYNPKSVAQVTDWNPPGF